jgi:putative transposase
MLRRDGYKVSKKLLRKLYKEEGLSLRWRKFTRKRSHLRVVPPPASRPNESWTLDFVSEKLSHGRRFRILTVIDLFSGRSLAVVPSPTFPSSHVVDELDRIIREKGCAPQTLTLDNGTEFTSFVLGEWARKRDMCLDFITHGRPCENGSIDSFNGKSGGGSVVASRKSHNWCPLSGRRQRRVQCT